MLLKRTNIEEKLARERLIQKKEASILQEVKEILRKTKDEEERILESLASPSPPKTLPTFNIDLLETQKIYHIDQIKKICIDYRLRFLDSKYFKGRIPQEALAKIGVLEKQHGFKISGFKIIAPSRLFKLEDKDDPLLFAPIGNNYFYLIHKWGDDLHPLRKLLVWPFKDMLNLVFLVLVLSYLVTLLIPQGLFSKRGSSIEFWILFFFMFKCIAAVVIFYGFALGKNFNPGIWNSKYYNT
ncbi:hypothetical protein K8352_09725 [Flavobacteriaceae bacterium F89]|uniref:Uncharacterized protein n=1 Tax=Cerina litoralis TaxID=2874477 RepID=A0AAE3JNJ6_9FLAO|nr:hypothetical protein [Cerina litoralis]MCG2461025.1 hypothetical protein [Cerina litoralis]